MSQEVKWIKLSVTIFDDEKIRLLESLPDGEAILVLWLKLLTLAGRLNADGHVFITETVPYAEEHLAAVFHCKHNLVKMALKNFAQLGMIEIDDRHGILIKNWARHQNQAGLGLLKRRELDRDRQRRHREPQKKLAGGSTGNKAKKPEGNNVTVTPSSRDNEAPSRDEERDTERDGHARSRDGHAPRDRIEKESKKEDPPTVPPSGGPLSPGQEIIPLEQAKALLNELFRRDKRAWSYEEQQLLAEICPLQRREWRLIRTWFRLPADHPVFEQTKRKQELVTFLRDFHGELDKMRTFEGLFFGDAPLEKKRKWPERGQEWFRWKYPEASEIRIPERFDELPADVRAEWVREHEDWEREHPPEEGEKTP